MAHDRGTRPGANPRLELLLLVTVVVALVAAGRIRYRPIEPWPPEYP